MGTVNRRGQVRWSPAWHIDTISEGVASDPMSFSVLDLDTSLTQDSTFWDTGLTLDGGGSSNWANGNISVNGGPSGSFFITMESPYLTSPQGHIHVAWSGGVITSHDETGIFAGLAPALGLPSNFGLHVGDASGNVDMNFDFGPDNASGFNMSMNASNSGLVSDPGVPEPATAALGIVGILSLAIGRGRNRLPRTGIRLVRSRCCVFVPSCARQRSEQGWLPPDAALSDLVQGYMPDCDPDRNGCRQSVVHRSNDGGYRCR